MDGTPWSGSRTSVITGNQNRLRAGLGNAGGNCSHPCFGNKLYRNIRVLVGVLQIVDKLRQILDRINIMVRRRGDQADSRSGVTGFCDPGIYFFCRKMSAFARFCSLRHLDLDLPCRHQIAAGHSEPSAGYLFNRGTAVVFCSGRVDSFITFPALSCV